jgi:hypothetical protein
VVCRTEKREQPVKAKIRPAAVRPRTQQREGAGMLLQRTDLIVSGAGPGPVLSVIVMVDDEIVAVICR